MADDIRATGAEAIFVETHTEREAEAAAFIRRARDEFGRLDVLVNNAGMRLYQTVVEASEASWDAILGVNLKGYAFCAKAAIPEMRRTGGGSIVNVASIRAVVVGGNTPQYDTTKAAVAGLTRAMAVDHAPRASASTPSARARSSRASTSAAPPPPARRFEEFTAEFGRGTMLKRPGTPREVATCILFLASDDASYVTGDLSLRGRRPDRDLAL